MFKSFLSGVASSFLGGIAGAFRGIQGQTTGDPAYMVTVHAGERGVTVMAFLPENFSSSVSSDYDTPFAEGFIQNEGVKQGLRMAGIATTTQIMSMQVWQGSAPMEFSLPMQFLYDSDTEADVMGPLRSLMSLALPSSYGSTGLSLGSGGIGNLSGVGGIMKSPGPKIRAKSGTTLRNIGERSLEASEAGLEIGTEVAADVAGLGTSDILDTDISQANNAVQEKYGDVFAGFNGFSLADVYDNISLQIGNFMYFPSVVITDVSSDYQIKLAKTTKKPIALVATVTFRTFVTPKAEDLANIISR